MDAYQYPPELFELLVEALPALTKSKESLLTFFRSAGISNAELRPIREALLLDSNSYSKYAISRRLLSYINEGGDRFLPIRRELLKRIVEYESFSACYPNQFHKAKALVADIRHLVHVR